MKLTKKKAKELSIKKWEYIVGNNGSEVRLLDTLPELDGLNDDCGYCEKYKTPGKMYLCTKCPINFGLHDTYGCSCLIKPHPFLTWNRLKSKANAQRVLDLIKES